MGIQSVGEMCESYNLFVKLCNTPLLKTFHLYTVDLVVIISHKKLQYKLNSGDQNPLQKKTACLVIRI